MQEIMVMELHFIYGGGRHKPHSCIKPVIFFFPVNCMCNQSFLKSF